MAAAAGQEAEALKAQGNELLKEGRIQEAVEAYGSAIALDSSVAAFWSNRSMALMRAGDADGALRDAEEAVRLEPTWGKGYHRRAKALQSLGRVQEGADACAEGQRALKASAGGASTKKDQEELGKLGAELLALMASGLLLGWWNGTVSEPLGGYEQEFNFQAEGSMQCAVYGQELPGTYKLSDVEREPRGGLRGGLDVELQGQKVPYLFRLGGEDGVLHLCCPMKSPPERPRSFDGPGYVGMRPGRVGGDAVTKDIEGLTSGQKILRYMEELEEIMVAQLNAGTSDPGAAERIRESLEESGGDTVNAAEVVGPETLEEKGKKLAAEQRLAALRVKFGAEVDEAAQKLINREVKPTEAYPAEARELERRLRLFRPKAEPAATAPAAPPPAAAQPPQAAQALADAARPAAAPAPAAASAQPHQAAAPAEGGSGVGQPAVPGGPAAEGGAEQRAGSGGWPAAAPGRPAVAPPPPKGGGGGGKPGHTPCCACFRQFFG